jgi:uncharacterized membrane protein (DUF4010 family)
MSEVPSIDTVLDLAAALTLGGVIGLERGWRARDSAEGSRVAGLRTFALLGLLGGVLGLLAGALGALPAAAGVAGLSVLAAAAYRENVRVHGSLSVTSAVTMVLTCALGVLAGSGQPVLAIGTAVIAAVLLDLKPTLHRWLQLVEQRELSAALQMLVLSVVILPLLPDRGYGPYEALNPYQLWWAVVLIAGLSLCGHLAIRVTGPQRGIFWTGLLGGLASSTAATLALARRVRDEPALRDAATAGALAASAMMFLRMTALVCVLQPALLAAMGAPMVVAALVLLAGALWQWRRQARLGRAAPAADGGSPFDLSTALGFGLLLGVLAVLTQAARAWLGDAGLYALSLVSGLVDVDAILLTVVQMNLQHSLRAEQAALAAALAVLANMGMKASLAWTVGGAALGRRVVAGYGVAAVAAIGAGILAAG